MATDHNFRVKNGLEVGGVLIANSSGQLVASSVNSNLKFSDDVQAQFGANADLKIYHDPNNSFILHSNTSGYFKIGAGTKELFLHGNRVDLRSETGNEAMVQAFHGGAVKLYYDAVEKVSTTSGGAQVTGDLSVSGNLYITGDVDSVSVTDLDVVDKTITVGQGQTASNSTGSGLVVAGANANMLWDNSDDRWEFNKDIFTSGKIDLGNNQIYASGDNNHLHINAPTAIIGPSTTTSSNPSLGTSTYRFDGVWSSTGNFAGNVTITGNVEASSYVSSVGGYINTNTGSNPLYITRLGNTNESLKIYTSDSGAIFESIQDETSDNYGNFIFAMDAGSTEPYFDIRKGTSSSGSKFYVDGSGKVGIGTISPSEKLHVYHTGTATYDDIAKFEYYDTDNSTLRYQAMLGPNGGTFFKSLVTGGNPDFKIIDQDHQTGRLSFQVQSNAGAKELLAVDSGGNVGIGTTSPNAKLEILSDGSAAGGAEIRLQHANNNSTDVVSTVNFANNAGSVAMIQGGTTGANNTGYISFHTDNAGSSSEVMRILGENQVAINGTTANTTGGTARLTIVDSTVQMSMGPSNQDNMYIRRMGGGLFQMQTYNSNNTGHIELEPYGGKVGIGTNGSVSATLHVQNTSTNSEVMRLTTTGDNPDRNMFFQSDHIYSNGNFHLGDGGYRNLYRGSYHTFHYGSSNSEAMRIQTNGNIGIGTTNPQGKLDVDGDLRVTRNIVSNTVYQMLSLGSDRTVDDYGGLNKDYWRINLATPGPNTDGGSSAHAYGTLIFSGVTGVNTTYVDRMAIMPGGNVGIGTNTPIQKLQVVGSVYANGGQFFLDSGNKLIWGNSQQWIQASNNGQMKFIVNNGERLYIQTDGRIETRIKRHARIDDVGNLGTTIRYYKIATVNKGNSGLTIKGTLANHVESFGTCKFDLAIFGREANNGANISVTGTIDVSAPNSGVRIVKQSGSGTYINYDVYLVVPKYCHADVEGTIHGNSNGTSNLIDWHGQNTYVTTAPTGAAIELDSSSLAAGHYQVTDSVISDAILDVPAAPSITSTTVVNETIELVFGQSATTGVDHYEVHSDGATGSDYSLIARIPPEDIASSMSVVDSSFDDSGTVAYRVYAVKNGVYSSPATTTRSFSMPSLDVSNMSVVPDTNSYHIQYNLPDTRFLDHVEIYVDAEASNSNLTRSGASLIYSGSNPSFKYNISSSDMEKYHQFWVECVSV